MIVVQGIHTFPHNPDAYAGGGDALAASDDYITWHADKPVKLRLASSGPRSYKPISVVTAFRQAVQRFPDHPALGMYHEHQLVMMTMTTIMEILCCFR